MKNKLREFRWNKIGLSNLYVISLVMVALFLLIKYSDLLLQTSLFDKASLVALKEQSMADKPLLFMILKNRIAIVTALFLMSTTSLGTAYVYMNVLWFGACSGLFLAIVLLRYGLRGILLLLAGIFPHYLIYVPVIILTLRLTRERRTVNGKFCAQLMVILFVVITGCLLECYVNPEIIAKLLKNF